MIADAVQIAIVLVPFALFAETLLIWIRRR